MLGQVTTKGGQIRAGLRAIVANSIRKEEEY